MDETNLFECVVTDEYEGYRIDKLISELVESVSRTYIKKLIDELYNDYLKSIVDKNISDIKTRFNLKSEITFEYKAVKTYFGECYPKRRLIILNKSLAKYDLIYILSVIYHEYAHFYYSNHQKGFYKLLDSLFPDYQNIQKNLRKIKYLDLY